MNRMPQVKEKLVENVENDPVYGEDIDDEILDDLKVIDDEIDHKLTDEDVNDILLDDDEVFQEKEEIIEPPPSKLNNKEIFTYKKKDNPLKVNKITKPKRTITDEHRERLRLGREKALATRRANKEKKLQGKASLVKEESAPAPLPQAPAPAPPQKEKIVYEKQDFSKVDIESMVATASAKALEDYELLRKQRKQKKVVAQKEETDRQKIRDTIHKAQTPSWKTDNPFSNCY
tara:strand:- start:3452 stop:4147 length:696 start_codon:yes stop_codon:yes gene_type:complete